MSRLPETGPSLTRWLRQQERNAQRQANSSAFNRSGISITAEGVSTVDGELDVTGDLVVSGHAAITGTLSLPSGIIDNDALANPVSSQSVYADISNFNLVHHGFSTPLPVIKTVTITVPAGFTAANVEVFSRVFAYNNAAAADFLACQTGIAGRLDYALGILIPAGGNGSGVAISPFATTLSALTPGDTFTITIGAASNLYDWTMAGNVATVSGNILWFR